MDEDVFLFEGLKVLDVGSWIAAPVAATMLADRGADVLKVEVPIAGDGYRNYALLPISPINPYHLEGSSVLTTGTLSH